MCPRPPSSLCPPTYYVPLPLSPSPSSSPHGAAWLLGGGVQRLHALVGPQLGDANQRGWRLAALREAIAAPRGLPHHLPPRRSLKRGTALFQGAAARRLITCSSFLHAAIGVFSRRGVLGLPAAAGGWVVLPPDVHAKQLAARHILDIGVEEGPEVVNSQRAQDVHLTLRPVKDAGAGGNLPPDAPCLSAQAFGLLKLGLHQLLHLLLKLLLGKARQRCVEGGQELVDPLLHVLCGV
mmetsp:Transcript_40184/g.113781  ORF Transcript_40184/g.113781 Transcript_40184/m.113781 type:complete len:237 (+) Transcript_40184:269-979(+)